MSDLVLGRMAHARPTSAEHAHRFSYAWFGIVARYPIQEKGRWFTHNRLGFLSFDDRDHGWRDGSDPLTWLQTELVQAGLEYKVSEFSVEILTMPRVLSFVFNPVSFWYLRDGEGHLMIVVAEVNNTFGGTHSYVLHQDGEPITCAGWITTPKQFYVSPFFEVHGDYRFSFRHQKDQTDVRLNHLDDDKQLLFATHLRGDRLAMSRGHILRHGFSALFRVWLALARIHIQAGFLYTKGVNLVPRDRGHGRLVKPKKTL
jgi:DUF1365 family protein